MAEILLATLNAKYIHAAFGLRYLLANLGALRSKAALAEFDLQQRPLEIAERLLAASPRVIGLGVYIWNVAPTTEVVGLLKRLRPDIPIVLGGPEVSFETDEQEIVRLADYVIAGEADLKFAEVCGRILNGEPPPSKVIHAGPPDPASLVLPYDLYSDDDLAHRVIYVEASRGCPFTCEFCLSSLDVPVRQFPLPALLEAFQKLLARGARQFKFVDRTFNLNPRTSRALLEFFLDRICPGMFLHFEMIPDRLPEALRELIVRFPPGVLQFEVGIQTFNQEVGRNISRRQDYSQLEENLRFLRARSGVHVHADLIAGLPGETLESFADGFDRLAALGPQEIQVGMLKRLRGTPIVRHDAPFEMTYSPHPPYEILRNKTIEFATMQRLRRFSRFWDLLGNSGNFIESLPLLRAGGRPFFWSFLGLADWLHAVAGRQHSIALNHLAELLFRYLTDEARVPRGEAGRALCSDYRRCGREAPPFLREFLPENTPRERRGASLAPKRQARRLNLPTGA